jgi:SAM-dependent methyltransferase
VSPAKKLPDGNLATQRAAYESGEHLHLRPSESDFYAAKLAGRLANQLGIRPGHRVLELGAGFGRFTFSLLEHCRSVIAVDLSERALAELDGARGERGIGTDRCRTLPADLDTLSSEELGEPVDFVVGFFLLHHLSDFTSSIERVGRFVRPGGGIGFLEPNRRNPLFLAQVMFCPDMDWGSEKGMFRLRRSAVTDAYREVGLTGIETTTFGMFPPQIFNRMALARRVERFMEARSLLSAWLPFLLMTARVPGDANDA